MKKLYWTAHSKNKMRFYRLSESRVKRAINNPERIEEGIAPKTAALMQTVENSKKPQEIWVMFQDGKNQRKIISVWRYPGKTKAGDPLPPEILKEFCYN